MNSSKQRKTSRTCKFVKSIPNWVYVTLFCMLLVGINLQVISIYTKQAIEERMMYHEKVHVTNPVDFKEIQQYVSDRYNAKASISYIRQPKSTIKIYKTLFYIYSIDDSTYLAPNKTTLASEKSYQSDLRQDGYVNITMTSNHENSFLASCANQSNVYAFPIYMHEEPIAEIILFFDLDTELSEEQIINIRHDIQVLGKLLD